MEGNMKATYDDSPGDSSEAAYSPRPLPGCEEMPTPEQGLLWADVGSSEKAQPRKLRIDTQTPSMFE
jgi:hypothetical protein